METSKNRIAAPMRNYLAGINTKEMIDEQMALTDHGCSLYYVMMGGVYNTMNSAMVDALYLLRQNKKYYRQQIKRDFNSAFKAYENWLTSIKLKLGGRSGLWFDVLDSIDETLRPDVVKLTFSFDNWLLKNKVPDNKLKASLQTVITLLDIADSLGEKMFIELQSKIKRDIRPLFKGYVMRDVTFYWNRACEPILRSSGNGNAINFNDSIDCELAARTIINKLSNERLYNRASCYALKLNPEQWKNLSKEDKMIIKNGVETVDNEDDAPTRQQLEELKRAYA